MSNNNSLKRQLTDSISIEIIPDNNSTEIKERIWAINWFNYKSKWLYNLYNKLASTYVVRVGGQLLFKGHNQKTLLGEDFYARQTLLIVTYPTISSFLDMVLIKAFQLVSLLRVNAVKDFVFGFTKRMDTYEGVSTPPLDGKVCFLVFHFKGESNQLSINNLALSYDLKTYFSGEKLAQIKRSEIGKGDVLAPFFMDGIMILETKTENNIKAFVASNEFTKLIEKNSNNYAAIFTRTK